MSLRPKIVLLLSAVVLLYAVIDHGIQRATVSRRFLELEREEATRDVRRVVRAIEKEIEHLDARCAAWARWDDAYEFVRGGAEGFVASNLGPGAFDKHDVDFVFLCDRQGTVVWGGVQDPDTGAPSSLRELPEGTWSRSHPLIPDDEDDPHSGRPDAVSGVFLSSRGPAIVSARPLHRSAGDGATAGTVVLGRFLAADLRDRLAEQTQVAFDLWPLDGTPLPGPEAAIQDSVTASVTPVLRPEESTLRVYSTIADIQKAPGLMVRADVPREISARGATSVRYALVSTMAAGLLILLVLLGLMQRTVLSPIARLTTHAVEIGRTENFTRKLDMERGDEIGILSNEFDDMMVKLDASRKALATTAREAGMSEIATGILHNVGNVLNSVNVSASVISARLGEMSVEDLEKLTAVLVEQGEQLPRFLEQDPRGQHLTPFLSAVSDQLSEQRTGLLEEISSLSKGVEHIRELINAQQAYAVKSTLLEATSVPDFLEKALTLSAQAVHEDRTEIEVVRDFDGAPEVLTDQHKLLDVFVNLVQNARQAMADVESPRLVLRVAADGDDLRVEITDNGCGIPAENLVRVFHHGFTTRKDGHGFGLHAAANAATELGGSLSATSAGPGRGATFVLRLPLRAPAHAGSAT